MRRVLPLQTHDLKASNGGDAMEFRASQLDRVFSQLGMAVRNENGRNQRFKFASWFASCPILQLDSQVDSQDAKLDFELVKWHTCA